MTSNLKVSIGDKVTFDSDKIETFKSETNSNNREVRQYRDLVLAGVDQIGVVKEVGFDLIIVSFADGWVLPIPTKYLIVLPEV